MKPAHFFSSLTNSTRLFLCRHTLVLSGTIAALLLVGILFVGTSCTPADASETILVSETLEPAPIVVYPDAPPRTKAVAQELADYIEKIAGKRPEVVDHLPENIPPRAIWVGYQPLLDTLFPGTDFDFKYPEEILIKADGNHLVIAGRDRWDEKHAIAEGRAGEIKDVQEEYGTANAIYTFIQDYLGVRRFWPGPTGEDIIKKKTIAFAPFEYRYHPPFRVRALFRLSVLGDDRGVSHDWVRFQRLQLDSLQVDPSHAFFKWWDRFHETHPEYFALQPDGTRGLSAFHETPAERAPRLVKLCLSNPAVWDQWLADVEEQLKQNPKQTIFNAAENDSFLRGVCVCENCRAWDAPTEQKYHYTWAGKQEERDGLSDRYARFWNTLARKLKERFPDKKLYVQGMGYGYARMGPVREKLEDNVIVLSVANICVAAPDMRKEHMESIKGWGSLAPIIWRPNVWGRAGKWGLPEVAIGLQAENFKLLADNNGIGMIFDTVWEHWATFAPQYYLMAQLAWNPRADANAIMEDYYQRAFGPAAESIKQYWSHMETLMDNPLGQATGLTDSFLEKSDKLLAKAKEAVATGPQIYRDRVDFIQNGLTFTRLMLDSLKARERLISKQIREPKGDFSSETAQFTSAWNTMEKWVKEHPGVVNPRFLKSATEPVNMANKRAAGRYLEYLTNIWTDHSAPDKEGKGEAVDLDLPAGQFE